MKQFYTITEISQALTCSQSFIYKNIQRKRVKASKKTISGKEVLIIENGELKRFLKENFEEYLGVLTRKEEEEERGTNAANGEEGGISRASAEEGGRTGNSSEEEGRGSEKIGKAITKEEVKEAVHEVIEERQFQLMKPLEEFVNGQVRFLQVENAGLKEKIREIEAREKVWEKEKGELEVLIGELREKGQEEEKMRVEMEGEMEKMKNWWKIWRR